MQQLNSYRSMAGLSAMLIVKIAQGLIRFRALYSDISGFLPSLKCILGFESVVDAIPDAAERVSLSTVDLLLYT